MSQASKCSTSQKKELKIMIPTRKRIRTAATLFVVLVFAFTFGYARAQTRAETTGKTDNAALNFDDVPVGKLPPEWNVEATNQKGPLATWRVVIDKTAPSGERALAMARPNHTFGGSFNICWTDAVSFLNGEVEVRFKSVKGEEDQGGGVIWRVQDDENYYIARFNPLEDNFRIYYVRDGARKTLASVRVALPVGKWHTLKIIQRGSQFEGYLNGRKLLKGSNSLFKEPGGVGLWTKADAVTSFDDFRVKPFAQKNEK